MPPPDPIPLLSGTPVVPVLTIERVEHAVPLARALAAGGLNVIEVTLRTRVALEAIAAIAAQVPECGVGAGTVLGEADVAAALAVGAKYLVSPGTTAELVRCRATKRPSNVTGFTPRALEKRSRASRAQISGLTIIRNDWSRAPASADGNARCMSGCAEGLPTG